MLEKPNVMKYNTIHQRYDLPLGLYFSIKFDTTERPNKWITISNIPALDHFVYEDVTNIKDIIKIIDIVIYNLGDFSSIEELVIQINNQEDLTPVEQINIIKLFQRYNN